MMIPGEE